MIILDSVTVLGPEARGQVVCAGSHGGLYAAWLCARAGVAGVVLNDAGFGLARAGVAGLKLLQDAGIAGATLSHRTARIGDGAHGATHGLVSEVNARAAALGVEAGMAAPAALAALAGAVPGGVLPPMRETRAMVPGAVLIDSASLLRAEDAGAVVLAGSHGGLLGGRTESALKYDAFAALFNDADGGCDGAGFTRLPALDARGIAAGTVSAWTARIGDGRSMWETGVVSALNATARRLGACLGEPARDFVARMNASKDDRR